MALREGRVVQPEVVAWDDDRHFVAIRVVLPVLSLHVEELFGYGFEEHIRRHPDAERQASRHAELRGEEAPDTQGKVLLR